MASERVVHEWRCGMCGHWSPRRCRARCQRCGAVRGYGYRDREAVEERSRVEPAQEPERPAHPVRMAQPDEEMAL